MIQPRNTLMVIELIPRAEKKQGAIIVTTNGDVYTEAFIVAVGPGNVAADGGRSETHDLRVGQRVFVKHKERRPAPGGVVSLTESTLPYQIGDKTYHLIEQTSILAVIAEPPGDACGCGHAVGEDELLADIARA